MKIASNQDWFWATFEHIDSREAAPATPEHPFAEGWLLASVDRFACPAAPHDCELAPAGIGLEGTAWEHYRLRGTQVDFFNSMGEPLILANSQPERTFQTSSSCITCHALASIDGMGDRLNFFNTAGEGPVGIPTGFFDAETGERKFTQLDFVWSFFRARPKQ